MKTPEILQDPDFHGLPEIERLKVLYKVDPDYRKLHPKQRWKVVSMIPTPPKQQGGIEPPIPPQGVKGGAATL